MPLTLNGTTGVAGIDGSAGTPSLQGSDTNTGVFYPAADTVGIAINGSEQFRVDSSGNLKSNSGYGSVATTYGCRAWANFTGTGTPTINGSGNISSIARGGFATGVYVLSFTNALPDANYSAVAATSGDVVTRIDSYAATEIRLVVNAAATNPTTASIAVFR